MNIKSYLRYDFPAGIVVFLVALPLCLGIALASGVPLFAGVISGIIGGIVVGFLSGSPLSVTGPAAGLATIVLAGVNELGFAAFLCAVVMAGGMQILAGYAKAGTLGHFFPSSVIKGMLAGIGLILILKQLPHAVGYDMDFEGDENFLYADGQNTFSDLFKALHYITPGAVVISLLSFFILSVWNHNVLQRYKFFRKIPAALIVVLIGIVLNFIFQQAFPFLAIEEKHLVSVPVLSYETSWLEFLTFPDFSQFFNQKVILAAFTIAAVASLETLLNIEATDKLDQYHRVTPLDRELKAQGVANVLAGLVGGLPVTSVVVRSSANVQAGGRSKASAITHGLILLLSVMLIPQLLRLIPLSALASILMVTGYKLSKPVLFKEMYQNGRAQFIPFVITLVAIVLTNLLLGVLVGLVAAIFFILKTNFQQAFILVNDNRHFLLKFTKDVSFLHKSTLRKSFEKIPDDATVTIDGAQSRFIDHDIREMIKDYVEISKTKNISVQLKYLSL
ncbi:MAG: Na(+)-dependent bicarbonate transporter BicA [Cytophagales bacterium]|jgi:MFS superfamily sulfate permease-like transporter|nr:MAG: Na(+)-dependent bicarbonate transporter BicA [Cytophagales bacterium]